MNCYKAIMKINISTFDGRWSRWVKILPNVLCGFVLHLLLNRIYFPILQSSTKGTTPSQSIGSNYLHSHNEDRKAPSDDGSGVPVIDAPGEAEAQCAELAKQGHSFIRFSGCWMRLPLSFTEFMLFPHPIPLPLGTKSMLPTKKQVITLSKTKVYLWDEHFRESSIWNPTCKNFNPLCSRVTIDQCQL